VAEDTGEDTRPLAYVRGVAPFMGYEFYASPGTIYPREVSSIVVNTMVDLVRSGALAAPAGRPLQLIDQCGGSGNLGCVLAMKLPEARVWTSDLMPVSSELARRNVEKHGLEGRVQVVTGDLFGAFAGAGLEDKVDGIICSPPFISTGRLARDRAYLLEHEPREAFDAGPYGISIHQRVVKECLPLLRAGGYLAMEFGEGQEKQVLSIINRTKAYDEVRTVATDGVPLAVCARKI
jgi:release factor glutamine methyltransferase